MLAVPVTADALAQDGDAKAFADPCAPCHSAPALAAKIGGGSAAGSAAGSARLEAFLERHVAADDVDDALIVNYLRQLAGG